jgi:hypothetical protein
VTAISQSSATSKNIALGARDAKYASFDMQLVLQKLLLKGSIVLKKAYCD